MCAYQLIIYVCVCMCWSVVPDAVPVVPGQPRDSPGAAGLFLLGPAGACLGCALPGQGAEGRQAGPVPSAAGTGGCSSVTIVLVSPATVVIIIIIAFKGAIRDFFNLLTAPQIVSNMYTQAARMQSCANHVQHIKRLSHATYVLCHVVRRGSSAIKYNRAYIAFI